MNLKEKRFRYGTFSTAMMLFAVILFVFVNLIADEFNHSFDMTRDGIYTLTDRSRDFLETVDTDVTITHITRMGQDDNWTMIVSQLLEEYEASNRHITVQVRDPNMNPALIHQMAEAAQLEGGIPEGSVVVQSGNNIQVVTIADMVIVDRNWMGQVTNIRSYSFEAAITRAIHGVTQSAPPVIYYVTGSGEHDLAPRLRLILEHDNFIVREVDLVTQEVPESADILLIPMPGRDWTETKGQRILDFLADEGRAFISPSLTFTDMPVFNGVLASYGIAPINHIVLEGSSNHVWDNNPAFILPNLMPHEINFALAANNLPNLMIGAIGLETLTVGGRSGTNIEPLWTTSRDAFARVDIEAETLAQIPGDLDGPFNLAVAITDTRFVETTLTTQLVVVGGGGMVVEDLSHVAGPGNNQFVLDAMRWLYGESPSIFIPGRVPPGQGEQIMLTQANINIMTGVAAAALPLLCIAVGIFVWFRRRHN